MPSQQLSYGDTVVTLHYSLFGGATTVDISCRLYQAKGMSLDDFMALANVGIEAKAKLLDPAVMGSDGILRAG
jgi:hypothetical protein